MNEHELSLFKKYKRRGVLLDTNILLVYFVGTCNREEITKFKRTKTFTKEDYDTLSDIIRFFDNKVFTTPNILTEVSNFSGQLKSHLKYNYFEYFSKGISLLTEEYTTSLNLSKMDKLYLYGLTDMSIAHISKGKCLVLTVDFDLCKYLQDTGNDAVNFNHIRDSYLST